MTSAPLSPARLRHLMGGLVSVALGLSIAGCGGSSSDRDASTPATAGAQPSTTPPVAASPTVAADGQTGAQWAADTCNVVDQSVVAGIVGLTVSSVGHTPTIDSVCNYMGAIPPDSAEVTFTALTFYDDRSEWDIHVANSGVTPGDKLNGIGADAFKSSDGIWVLLEDGRMFIADVVYGVEGEDAKELALATAIAAGL